MKGGDKHLWSLESMNHLHDEEYLFYWLFLGGVDVIRELMSRVTELISVYA